SAAPRVGAAPADLPAHVLHQPISSSRSNQMTLVLFLQLPSGDLDSASAAQASIPGTDHVSAQRQPNGSFGRNTMLCENLTEGTTCENLRQLLRDDRTAL